MYTLKGYVKPFMKENETCGKESHIDVCVKHIDFVIQFKVRYR